MPKHLKKKVILVLIDTLMDSNLQEALKNGKAPAFQFFLTNGHYIPDMVSPFPTMSVNVDSTLLTGTYCDRHKIPGLVWYHEEKRRIVNYGSHLRELYKLGAKRSAEDIFYRLNHEHLSKDVKTIHERLNEQGKVTASIGALLYRGSHKTELTVPWILTKGTGLPEKIDVQAPPLFSYGAFHPIRPEKKYAHLWQRYGFNDRFATEEFLYLLRNGKLPSFTLLYFPDLDQIVHKNGRFDTKGIERVNDQLENILNTYRDWTDALRENIWILTGDNGQAWISNKREEALIDLRRLLKPYKIMKLRKGVTDEDEIALAVNERMAFIYTLDSGRVPLDEIAETLRKDNRIDVIALKKGNSIVVTSGLYEGSLRFSPGGPFTDEYGQSWSLDGNHKLLNLTMKEGKIEYGFYPDALARLYSSFFSHGGAFLVVSANPGHEFIGEGSPTHVGGAAHGGLHKQDSLVSTIVSGTDSLPKDRRIVNMKDWILSLQE